MKERRPRSVASLIAQNSRLALGHTRCPKLSRQQWEYIVWLDAEGRQATREMLLVYSFNKRRKP